MGFFRWLLSAFGMSKQEPWSLTVGPYQVGIVIWDGAVLDIFSEGTLTLPEGDVQTFVASTAPVKFTYGIRGTGESSNAFDIVLDPPPLTSDEQHATGRIDLTVSVMAQSSRFTSVIPEKADRLLQLLGLSGDVVKKSDIATLIRGDLSPRLLALDLRVYSADDLRNNQERVRDISNLLRTELASAVDRYGLQLDDFYVNWAPQPPQKVSTTKRSARDSLPEYPKTRKGGRSSSTRRQPVSKRKTIKTVIQHLDESGLFNNGVWQETEHYKVSFQVTGRRGARVFVTHDESEFLISNRALKNDKFSDSETLYDFLLSHAHGTVRGKAKISAEHIEAFIDLIRAGPQENPKSRRASRSSPTRRQPASKRTTSKSTAHMSAMQQLRHSKLFDEREPQQNGTVSFQVTGWAGATIYVTKNELALNIIERALLKDRFPNNENLHDFVRKNKLKMAHGKGSSNYCYVLNIEHTAEIIELIHSGLPNAPKAHQRSRPSQTRSKRSVDNSTAPMTVLEKFIKAFPTLHEEKKSDNTISFGRGATVYFRKTRVGPNEARISTKWVQNFPNASKLQAYLKRSKVPIDPSESHPDYKIGPKHADQVIAILKMEG